MLYHEISDMAYFNFGTISELKITRSKFYRARICTVKRKTEVTQSSFKFALFSLSIPSVVQRHWWFCVFVIVYTEFSLELTSIIASGTTTQREVTEEVVRLTGTVSTDLWFIKGRDTFFSSQPHFTVLFAFWEHYKHFPQREKNGETIKKRNPFKENTGDKYRIYILLSIIILRTNRNIQ